MKNYYLLDFFANPVRDDFQFPELTDENYQKQKWYLWHYVDGDNFKFISPDIANWAAEHNLTINHCHLFAGPPHENSIIHSDGPEGENQFGINWVLTGHDSYMAWYKTIVDKDTSFNFSNSPYRWWDESECEEIERSTLQGPTLINAATPHRIVNNSNEYRWTVSLRFSNAFKSWNETVEFFKPYFKTQP